MATMMAGPAMVRRTRDFTGVTFTEQASAFPHAEPPALPVLDKVIRVSDPIGVVFSADPSRVVSSDGPGDCTNQLRIEFLTCGVQCNFDACGVHVVA